MKKAEVFPYYPDALQQNSLAGFRSTRPDKLRGHLAQLAAAGKICGACGAKQRNDNGDDSDYRIEDIRQLGYIIHYVIAFPYRLREQPRAGYISRNRADERRAAGIGNIFEYYFRVGISERLERPYESALIFDHPGHGVHAYERRHKEEEYRKHFGDAVHYHRIVFKAVISYIDIAPENIAGGFLYGVYIGLRVVEFAFGVGKLCLGLGESVLRLLL